MLCCSWPRSMFIPPPDRHSFGSGEKWQAWFRPAQNSQGWRPQHFPLRFLQASQARMAYETLFFPASASELAAERLTPLTACILLILASASVNPDEEEL